METLGMSALRPFQGEMRGETQDESSMTTICIFIFFFSQKRAFQSGKADLT